MSALTKRIKDSVCFSTKQLSKLKVAPPGVDLKKLLGANLLTLFCKLDLFITKQQILPRLIKWSSLQKSVSNFTP